MRRTWQPPTLTESPTDHGFLDGNKRTRTAVTARLFLADNGRPSDTILIGYLPKRIVDPAGDVDAPRYPEWWKSAA